MGKKHNKRKAPAVQPAAQGRHRTVYIAIGVVVLCAAVLAFALASTKEEEQPPTPQEEGQVVLIGLKGARYTPDVITVTAGEPVTLKNDGTIRGCGMYVVQRELGIYANFAQSPTYTFTPTKKGTFTYACSMGMYQGTIQVV